MGGRANGGCTCCRTRWGGLSGLGLPQVVSSQGQDHFFGVCMRVSVVAKSSDFCLLLQIQGRSSPSINHWSCIGFAQAQNLDNTAPIAVSIHSGIGFDQLCLSHQTSLFFWCLPQTCMCSGAGGGIQHGNLPGEPAS